MEARTESPDLQNGYHASNGYGTRTLEIVDEVRSRDDARHNTENSDKLYALRKNAYMYPWS
jgi:hypothetical protein